MRIHNKLFLLLNYVYTSKEQPELVALFITKDLPKTEVKPFFTKNQCSFYEVAKEQNNRAPTSVELLNYIRSKEKFTFDIGKKTFNIYPMKYVEVITNNKSKILGYFDKMHTSNGVMFKYKNGHRTVYNASYSSAVRFTFDKENSFEQVLSSSPDKFNFEIKLNSPSIQVETKRISLRCNTPTIGSKLLELLSKEQKEVKDRSSFNKKTFFNIIDRFATKKESLEILKKLQNESGKAVEENEDRLDGPIKPNTATYSVNENIIKESVDPKLVEEFIKEVNALRQNNFNQPTKSIKQPDNNITRESEEPKANEINTTAEHTQKQKLDNESVNEIKKDQSQHQNEEVENTAAEHKQKQNLDNEGVNDIKNDQNEEVENTAAEHKQNQKSDNEGVNDIKNDQTQRKHEEVQNTPEENDIQSIDTAESNYEVIEVSYSDIRLVKETDCIEDENANSKKKVSSEHQTENITSVSHETQDINMTENLEDSDGK